MKYFYKIIKRILNLNIKDKEMICYRRVLNPNALSLLWNRAINYNWTRLLDER